MDTAITILQKKVNEIFEIKLTGTPGAGFVWTMADLPSGLILVEKKTADTGHGIGGSTIDTFVLKGKDEGKYTLTFSLGRAWEKKAVNQKEYKIDIQN